MRVAHVVTGPESGSRLDLLVGAWLARDLHRPLSKSVVRKLIVAGAVRVNGGPDRRPAATVQAGARLEAHINLALLEARAHPPDDDSPPSTATILYEDEDLIAVAKPAGIVMHATADPKRADLFTIVRRELDLPYLALHHRLDVETSGVVLFARRQEANAGLADQFAGGKVTKVYHAIAQRPPGRLRVAWRVENRLALGAGGRRARMQPSPRGVPARTDFTVLERFENVVLVEARPCTGRKHQVRAHLAGSHAPILGDPRYGGPMQAGRCRAPRVMLHAARLALHHPVTGAPLTIDCPYPPDFEALLACLRSARPPAIRGLRG